MTYQYKQTGFAPIAVILMVVIGIGVVAGIGYFIKNKASQSGKLQEENQSLNANVSETSQEGLRQEEGVQPDEFSPGMPEDLVIGEKVVVRGTINQDGSITAETIHIGVSEEDFGDMPRLSPDNKATQERSPEGGRPSLPEGIDPEEFKNLSREERMERMREVGGNRAFSPDAGYARGDIIDKDEMSITIKLTEGGSKLVFYSDSTRIIKVDES